MPSSIRALASAYSTTNMAALVNSIQRFRSPLARHRDVQQAAFFLISADVPYPDPTACSVDDIGSIARACRMAHI